MSQLRSLRNTRLINHVKNSARYGGANQGPLDGKYYLSKGEIESPGDYFKYKYMFDDTPEYIGRYKPVATCPYADRVLFEWDNYIFEYYGQWWDIGKARYHFYFIGQLFLFMIGLTMSNMDAAKERRTVLGRNDASGCRECEVIEINYR